MKAAAKLSAMSSNTSLTELFASKTVSGSLHEFICEQITRPQTADRKFRLTIQAVISAPKFRDTDNELDLHLY